MKKRYTCSLIGTDLHDRLHLYRLFSLGCLLLAAFLALVSCNEKSSVNPVLGFKPAVEQIINQTDSIFTVEVRANLEWNITLSDPQAALWCHLDKFNGKGDETVTVTINANDGPVRTVSLQFNAEGVETRSLDIRQKAYRTPVANVLDVLEDEVFRDYCERFDTNGDDILTEAEAEKVTTIDLTKLIEEDIAKIKSLKGLEYFPKLTTLLFSGTQVETVDLTYLSELTRLECNDNPLAALDVTQCVALQTLYCFNTPIALLDVSQNTKLQDLRCYNTLLTGLFDMTTCPDLRQLWCHTTEIREIDISRNEQLRWFQADPNPDLRTIYVWEGFKSATIPEEYKIPPAAEYLERKQ